MKENIKIDIDANEHQEIVIKIDLEDVFHGRQCIPEHDPGTVVYYIIRVDKHQFELREHELTGRNILKLVNLSAETHRLYQIAEGSKEILPDELVDFRACGIERFKSVAKHANEGMEVAVQATPPPSRKMVELLSEDVTYLNRMYPDWETICSGNTGWILIRDFPIPNGFNIAKATVAFLIPPSYPVVEFDMMYFFPSLCRADGKQIGALTDHQLDAKTFQRWSRHRNSGVWQGGIDNLETHVLSVIGWLEDELKK